MKADIKCNHNNIQYIIHNCPENNLRKTDMKNYNPIKRYVVLKYVSFESDHPINNQFAQSKYHIFNRETINLTNHKKDRNKKYT